MRGRPRTEQARRIRGAICGCTPAPRHRLVRKKSAKASRHAVIGPQLPTRNSPSSRRFQHRSTLVNSPALVLQVQLIHPFGARTHQRSTPRFPWGGPLRVSGPPDTTTNVCIRRPSPRQSWRSTPPDSSADTKAKQCARNAWPTSVLQAGVTHPFCRSPAPGQAHEAEGPTSGTRIRRSAAPEPARPFPARRASGQHRRNR